MRVNIISNFGQNTGLNQDTFILRGILVGIFDKDVSIACVPYIHPHCEEADVNIFLEVVNPSLFAYARKNIWIPNIEWTYRNWVPYLDMIDEIWVKTKEAEDVLTNLTKTPVRNIGWTSIDKVWDTTMKKNYHKAFVPVGKNIYRHPRPIFQAYMRLKESNTALYEKLPTLHVVYSPNHLQVTVPESIQEKVIVKSEVLKEKEYDELLKECGVCICTSLAEGFGHAVNEAMSVGCNLILSPIRPFVHDLVGEVQIGVEYCQRLNAIDQNECIGTLMDVTIQSICDALERYVNTPFKEKKNGSENIRNLYEHRHKSWVTNMREFLPTILDKSLPEYRLKDVFPSEENLPDVSIITLTKDRRNFMPLAKYCYLLQTYPEDKMEWVIIDDGEDSIEDTLIGIPNVTYVRCDPGMTISQKRNLAVSKAMYDVIVVCDDDDVYPENTILHRVAMMLKNPSKECAFCTTIPCYDITKYSSFMNVPPYTLPMSQRVSEATLIFTRKFWEDNKFDETINVAEGDAFIRGREQMCRELSPQEVIVSLTHPKNLSSRKIPDFKEPNGCHYGFNEKLFALVSEIGLSMEPLNTSGQTEHGETRDESCETSGDGHQ
jgi:glycosyltransferase involved in cell wall biosynthesis